MRRFLTQTTAWSLYAGIVALYGFSLWALVKQPHEGSLISWQEISQILGYSLLQATLSASFSLLLGGLLARAFFYLPFKGKALLYRLFSFVWALPSLVVIFAVVGAFGNSGWLAQLTAQWGGTWQFNVYGLQGILLAHCIFNIPLVMKYYTQSLMQIPSSQHQLAAQLNLHGWHYFRIVELPTVKTALPSMFMTVFLVCFTSFPIVLMLGGSPKYSTLEVAIYQAVTFEFDFAKAVSLIAVQFMVGIGLQAVMSRLATQVLKQPQATQNRLEIWTPKPTGVRKFALQAVIFLQIFTIILPLASVVWSGVSVPQLGERLLNPALWHAAAYSLILSLIAALCAVGVSALIALEARQLLYRKANVAHSVLGGVTIYPLLLPIFLLAIGLFLLLMNRELSNAELLLLVGVCNGLTLLPFIYPMIFSAMWHTLTSHDKLAQSLNLTGFRRFWIVEKTPLIRPLANAFALAMSSGVGSFAVIAFFGNSDFSSLPFLLYQQLGNYRTEDAAVTALVLMLFSLLPFLCIKDNQ